MGDYLHASQFLLPFLGYYVYNFSALLIRRHIRFYEVSVVPKCPGSNGEYSHLIGRLAIHFYLRL